MVISSMVQPLQAVQSPGQQMQDPEAWPFSQMPDVLPGTEQLDGFTNQSDLSASILEGAHRLIERMIEEPVTVRKSLWNRDFGSEEAYSRSIEANRKDRMSTRVNSSHVAM